MNRFAYRKGELFCEGVAVRRIARRALTPVYLYSRGTLEDHFRRLKRAFAAVDPLVAYSVKVNSSLAVLKVLKRLGAWFDIVSGGELARVLAAGGDPARIVFAGVGKTEREIEEAIRARVGLFNVESEEELALIDRMAGRMGRSVEAALRVNPDVDPKTHRYITTGRHENKFGVDLARAGRILGEATRLEHLSVVGIHAHIGSQITTPDPYRKSLAKIVDFLLGLPDRGRIRYLNCGGGFGAHYRGSEAVPAADFARAMVPLVRRSGCRLILEPGRFIAANAGVLVTEVQFVKRTGAKTFVILDAGMQTLIRPSLYGSFHKIWPVAARPGPESVDWSRGSWEKAPRGTELVDIVGPICESGDFLAQGRPLPPVKRGDLLAVFTAGAYGFVMASRYNSHPLPAEVLVEGRRWRVIRERETYADLTRGEWA